MKFEIATRSIAATKGQDRIYARVFDDVTIFALADGSGGRPGGTQAAQLFISQATKVATEIQDPSDAQFWAKWLEKIDALIQQDQFAGETTAIIAALGPNYIAGASVGDSEAWLIGTTTYQNLTQNQIQRPFLGSGGAVPRPFSNRLKNEIVLLASDGLIKYADSDHLIQIVRDNPLETAVESLIAAVQTPSGTYPDDVSCILGRSKIPDFPIATPKAKPKLRLRLSLSKPRRNAV